MQRTALSTAALLCLCACGGTTTTPLMPLPVGGNLATPSPDPPPSGPSFLAGSTGTVAMTFTGYEGGGTLRAGVDESTVDLASGVVTGGGFAGTLNAGRTEIALTGGGSATLSNPGFTEYVRFFSTSGTGAAPVFGVVGFDTDAAQVPRTGRASYTGHAEVVATDATALYTLSGTAFVEANFGAREVDVELRDLSGTRSGIIGGTAGDATLSSAGTIVVEGAALSGAGFSGGVAFSSGTPFTLGGGSANTSGSEGRFFGPSADEVAGRVVIVDAGRDVTVLGRYAAD